MVSHRDLSLSDTSVLELTAGTLHCLAHKPLAGHDLLVHRCLKDHGSMAGDRLLDLFCLIPWLTEQSIVKLPNSPSYGPQSTVPRLVPTGLVGLTCHVGTLSSITGI